MVLVGKSPLLAQRTREKWGTRLPHSNVAGSATIYCRAAYSDLACFRMGTSGSASFQRVRKSLYAARARTRAAPASVPWDVFVCIALARATPRCAKAPVQQFHTVPLWSRIF